MKASEVAATLGISLSTLRKYALLLEKNNYQFERDSQNNRSYSCDDMEILGGFIKLRKQYPKMTNEEILSELKYDAYLQMPLSLNEKKQNSGETVAKEIEVLKTEMDRSQQRLNQIYALLISITEHSEKQEMEMKKIEELLTKITNKRGIIF